MLTFYGMNLDFIPLYFFFYEGSDSESLTWYCIQVSYKLDDKTLETENLGSLKLVCFALIFAEQGTSVEYCPFFFCPSVLTSFFESLSALVDADRQSGSRSFLREHLKPKANSKPDFQLVCERSLLLLSSVKIRQTFTWLFSFSLSFLICFNFHVQ